jgi:hypothetical protein
LLGKYFDKTVPVLNYFFQNARYLASASKSIIKVALSYSNLQRILLRNVTKKLQQFLPTVRIIFKNPLSSQWVHVKCTPTKTTGYKTLHETNSKFIDPLESMGYFDFISFPDQKTVLILELLILGNVL